MFLKIGFGIKKNPVGIKNFLRFARTNFSSTPQFAFIIGKGMNYSDYREWEFHPMADRLNLVPTWGFPASDVMLASTADAIIIGFNVRPDATARRSAEREKIDVRLYRVIYEAIEDVKKALSGMLEPEIREKVIGHAAEQMSLHILAALLVTDNTPPFATLNLITLSKRLACLLTADLEKAEDTGWTELHETARPLMKELVAKLRARTARVKIRVANNDDKDW